MQAELQGETRPVIRHRRGVIWCPFCDTSAVDRDLIRCASCTASYTDEASEVISTAAPRTRRARAEEVEATPVEEGTVVEEPQV